MSEIPDIPPNFTPSAHGIEQAARALVPFFATGSFTTWDEQTDLTRDWLKVRATAAITAYLEADPIYRALVEVAEAAETTSGWCENQLERGIGAGVCGECDICKMTAALAKLKGLSEHV